MKQPVIGIIPCLAAAGGPGTYTLREMDTAAIADHGGLPLVLPYTTNDAVLTQYLSLIDGLYFVGGCDILPAYFQEEPHPALGALCPARDAFEIALYRRGAALDLPMLGICRGMQIMNVAAGGTLYQDLYSQLPGAGGHSPKGIPRFAPFHTIQIVPDSQLAALLGDGPLAVNSLHHQAIRQPAPGYRITATAPDGVAEAMENPDLTFAVAVQWHPEDMYTTAPVFAALYQAFIAAAGHSKDT